MHPNLKEASEHIKTYLENGVPEMHIREHYVNHGWSSEWFEQALAHAKADLQSAPQPPQPVFPPQPDATQNVSAAAPAEQGTQQPAAFKAPKYRLFRAIKDYFDVVAKHPRQYFSAAGIGILAYFVALIPVGLFVALIVLLKPHGPLLGVLIGLAVLLVLFWYAFATTFFMVITSWVLAPWNAERNEPVKEIVKDAWSRTPRAALSVAFATVIMLLPVLVTVFILLMSIYAAFSRHSNPGAIIVLIGFLMLLSFVWLLIASLRLALVQQVAVFEPELKMVQTLKRSSYLLKSGGFVNNGQWFLLKGFLLLLALNIVLSLFTHASLRELQESNNIVLNLILLVASIITQGVLAMLYFNRAAVFPKHTS